MSYSSEVLADSPAVFLRCQEASSFPQDSSGNARHCTASPGGNNATYHTTSPIVSDGSDFAIDFSTGTNFTVPDQAGLDLGDVFTMEAWVKLASLSPPGDRYIITKGAAAYSIWVDSTNHFAIVAPTLGVVNTATTAFTDLNWHHVAATKTGATVKLYLDGVDVTGTNTNQTFVNTAETLFIGSSRTSSAYCDAQLDEVAVYPTALTQARLQAHFNAASFVGQTLLPDADLAAGGWTTAPLFSKLNDGSDATIITATAS